MATKGRRPSVESLDAKIARLERIVVRGRQASEQISTLQNRRVEVQALLQASQVDSAEYKAKLTARLEAQRAKVAALEAQLATTPSTVATEVSAQS